MKLKFVPLLLLLAINVVPAIAGAEDGHACVVLLHGMARTSGSMKKMQRYLEDREFVVANVDYPSRDHQIAELAKIAVEDGLRQCRANEGLDAIHFVTHSLGGILVRYYSAHHDIAQLGRVVMLAPPNQGSHAADAMRGVPGFGWINGPAAMQLGKGPDSVPLSLGKPGFEFAVIAGNRTIDPITSAVLENPDDGRVTVEDTKLEGMSDFRVVDASHAYIMKKKDVMALVYTFLAYGTFDKS